MQRLFTLLFAVAILTATCIAQTPTATVTGTVLDTTGGSVPDARPFASCVLPV